MGVLPGILVVVAVLALTSVFWWRRNWLMPDIFGLATITVWQALGLMLLTRLLFSGSGSATQKIETAGGRREEKPAQNRYAAPKAIARNHKSTEQPEVDDEDSGV